MGVESKKQLTGAVKGSPLLRGDFFVVGQGVAFAGKRLGGAWGGVFWFWETAENNCLNVFNQFGAKYSKILSR